MEADSPILRALAARYYDSQAGRTGQSANDFIADYRDLLKAANSTDGEALIRAEKELRLAAHESNGLLALDMHPRDERLILRVRLTRAGGETWLFSRVGQTSPTELRQQLATVFANAAEATMAAPWLNDWSQWCAGLAEQARCGGALAPFSRDDLSANEELLRVLRAVLGWRGESLIRFASCVICGDSKRLGYLRSKLEACLTQLSKGRLTSFEDVGLLETPRQALVHGPVVLVMADGVLDLGLLRGPVSISEVDLRAVRSLTTSALRCLTVENETTFHELAKLNSGTVLIQTSYPGRAVLEILRCLPEDLPCWHFGDTDPAGFDILRDLRKRSGRRIESLHMKHRPSNASKTLSEAEQRLTAKLCDDPLLSDVRAELEHMSETGLKGNFEQETLGKPTVGTWPFYQNVSCSSQNRTVL